MVHMSVCIIWVSFSYIALLLVWFLIGGDNIAPHSVKNLNILFSKTQPYFITIVTCPLPRLYIGIICGSLINFVNFLPASFKKTEWFQCHNFTKFSFCFVSSVVELKTESEMKKALKKFQNHEFFGKKMKLVDVSTDVTNSRLNVRLTRCRSWGIYNQLIPEEK